MTERNPASGIEEKGATAAAGLIPTGAVDGTELARRWRLILGKYSSRELGLPDQDTAVDRALGFLYDREYTRRGHRGVGAGRAGGRGGGSLDPSALTALTWLGSARELFPKSTFERMQSDAIGRYQISEILCDPQTAETLEPDKNLATALLHVRGKLDERAAAGLRIVISKVVEEVVQRLRPQFTTALAGRRNSQRSLHTSARNLDWRATLRANLNHWDPGLERLMISDVRFVSRARRTIAWDVVLLVDQSGSMAASLLYSAVCAGIMTGLPGINVRLILFDTSVVDISHMAHDPVSVLLTAQLGGGTDIARAMRFAEQQVTAPSRTVVALVSDFEEGGSVANLLATVRRLSEAGVKLLGLAALDEDAEPVYDRAMARRLADLGMNVAALTPDQFAQWLAEVLR